MLLDGFPRTTVQAEKLDSMFASVGKKVDRVIEFKIDDSILIERIEGRRVHKASGRSYHLKFNPPKVADLDDLTGDALIQRPDDNMEVLKKRMEAYHQQTSPILEFYRRQNALFTINANQSMPKVKEDIFSGLYA